METRCLFRQISAPPLYPAAADSCGNQATACPVLSSELPSTVGLARERGSDRNLATRLRVAAGDRSRRSPQPLSHMLGLDLPIPRRGRWYQATLSSTPPPAPARGSVRHPAT